MEDMGISEKELKLLISFVQDDLDEALESDDMEDIKKRIKSVRDKFQQYLED